MGKLLKGIGNEIKDATMKPLKLGEQIVTGKFDDALDTVKHIPGDTGRNASEMLNGIGIRGWVGDHPLESAAAVVGTVLGGMYALPAAAGSAAGAGATAGSAGVGATATGAGTASSVGSLGTGLGMTYAPTASAVMPTVTSAAPTALTYTPTASTVLGGSGATNAGLGFTLPSNATLNLTTTAGDTISVAGNATNPAANSNVIDKIQQANRIKNMVSQQNQQSQQQQQPQFTSPVQTPQLQRGNFQAAPSAFSTAQTGFQNKLNQFKGR